MNQFGWHDLHVNIKINQQDIENEINVEEIVQKNKV